MIKLNNKKISIFVVLLMLVSTISTFLYFELSEDDLVVTVNGEQVKLEEFNMILKNGNIANTYNYFKTKYGIDDSSDFWNSKYGGEVPIEYAKNKTLEDIVSIKMKQTLIEEYDIVKDTSYEALKKSLKTENNTRKEALKKGQVIYGPKEYDTYGYFNYTLSNNIIKLKSKMGETTFIITDEDLKKRYENVKDKLYKQNDYIKVQVISSFIDNDGVNKEQAFIKIKSAMEEIKGGSDFEAVAKKFNKSGMLDEYVYDENSARHDNINDPNVKETFAQLKPGGISGVVELDNGYQIFKLIKKETNRYQSYDEIKQNVQTTYIDEEFEKLVNKMAKDAKIVVNQKVYMRINP